MPLTIPERDVPAPTLTADWGAAGGAFLGIEVAEAAEAESLVIPRGELLASQWLLAPSAQETDLVPGLLTIGHTSRDDRLFAVNTLWSQLLLITGQAVVEVVLGNETLDADWLLAVMTQEAALMPIPVVMLHFLRAWHDGHLALVASGGILLGVAFNTQ